MRISSYRHHTHSTLWLAALITLGSCNSSSYNIDISEGSSQQESIETPDPNSADGTARPRDIINSEHILVNLTSSSPSPIIQGKNVTLNFQVQKVNEDSPTTWMVLNYSVGGGITTFHPHISSRKTLTRAQKNQLSAGTITIDDTLQRQGTLILFTVRNLTLCQQSSFTDAQCMSKYSFDSFSEHIDHKVVAMVEARPRDLSQKIDHICAKDDTNCIALVKKYAQEMCSKLNQVISDYTIPLNERLLRAGGFVADHFTNPNRDLFSGLLAAAAAIEAATTTQTSYERKEEKKAREAVEQELRQCHKDIGAIYIEDADQEDASQ